MKTPDVFQFIFFLVVITVFTPLLGSWMARVFQGQKHFLSTPLGWLERLIYRVSGISEKEDMNWRQYAVALMAFSFWGILTVFLVQIFQASLPMNPQNLPNVPWHLALNTAVSFITNTNWQSYGGESTMSYLTQMTALTVHNFLSAATGIAVFLVFARAITRKQVATIGNFWVDLVRSTLYVLLPIAFVLAIFMISQGVIQNFATYVEVTGLDGIKQLIAMGPVASQEAIKVLGTNGGGFFNVNSAHPFENPTPLTNFLQMLSIFLIPAALTYTYGKMVGSAKHGWAVFAAMMTLFVVFTLTSYSAEYSNNAVFAQSAMMEGKETRFGVGTSILFSTITTSASCGAVNAMHSSLSPLSGGIALLNMMLGEVVFGGVGAGMYGMIIFIILTVFLAGLMVGRTPEYLGKKIEAWDMKMVTLAILFPSAIILLSTAISVVTPIGLSSLANKGPHGFSEVLYAFTSAAANNGSAFAGLNGNTIYYNLMLAFAMFIGRFGIIIPFLAIAGNLAKKKISPLSSGTFPTDNVLFVGLLIAVILIVGALTFFPALTLGPIVEHLLMLKGISF
ncbi:MAG: potassium-transporting ATPase subunit KdpA [Bdellovibrionaceae bacterium]|nr:potassium-transporting ATPase subunit KdpA [Pseudobdellovibrionaceae bacterium]